MPYLVGKNSIIELLKAQPSRIKKIHCSLDLGKSYNSLLAELINQNSIKVLSQDKFALDRLAPNSQHQGVVAEITERKIYSLSEYLNTARNQHELILILDQISDPHNFGAILRAAECFGVSAVLWSNVRNSGITDVVTKVSVGASELVNLIQVTNISQALKELKKNNFWIAATAIDEGAEPIQKFKFPEKTALILGSEGEGIKHILLENSDFKVYLPMYGQIDSLNVSQAAAVFLTYWRDAIAS